MSEPIWPVVAENLAEEIASTQAGRVHPSQLLPYLPMSLELIERALDKMVSDRIVKERIDGLECYTFVEYFDRPVTSFSPDRGVYLNEPLDGSSHSAVGDDILQKIEGELGALAASDPWPANAVWQHELIFLIQNLPAPVQLSSIAGHSRLTFRKVEQRLKLLQKLGAVHFNLETATYSLPPMEYPRDAYKLRERFVRQFPGALKEEGEVKIVKALFGTFAILGVCFLVAITAKVPFPILFLGGIVVAAINFVRVLKSSPKPLPEI